MQTVKPSVLTFRKVMKNHHSYKMERKDNCVVTDGEYEGVELVSKSGDSLLISLVQNYPHLYVKTSKNQKDNALREKSWQEIAAILEQPGRFFFFQNLHLFIQSSYMYSIMNVLFQLPKHPSV